MLASRGGHFDTISRFGSQATTVMASRVDLEAITVVACVPNYGGTEIHALVAKISKGQNSGLSACNINIFGAP